MYPYKFRKGRIIDTQLDEVRNLDNPTITIKLKENGFFKFKTYETNLMLKNSFDELCNYAPSTKVYFWTNKDNVISLKVIEK